jgi:hypothetical protein
VNTSGPHGALARALVIALAAGTALAASAAPVAAAPGAPAPVVFFWSSPSRADVQARPRLVAAVNAAAAASRARVLDLSPPAVRAPDTASRVARAVAAYDAMRFSDAIFELDAAATAAAEHGAWGLSRDALVDLYLYRALARTEAGDEAAAWNDFVRAATIDPSRVLDPARFRPSAVKSFTRAVGLVSARAPVSLTVQAPSGSRIFVDGRSTGRDQLSESLLPGEHYLWVERPSAPPFARTVTLAAAVTVSVPEDAARPPDDAELRRRAVRLGAGTPLVIALSRQGGVAMAELRSLEPRGALLRGAVRLGPSLEADARDLGQAAGRALEELAAAGVPPGAQLTAVRPEANERRWYHSRWVWVAVGVAGALVATSPLLFDSSGGAEPRREAALDPGPLEP